MSEKVIDILILWPFLWLLASLGFLTHGGFSEKSSFINGAIITTIGAIVVYCKAKYSW